MAEEGLKIRVGADVSGVFKSIDDLKKEFQSLSQELGKTTDAKRITELNKELERTSKTLQAIKTAGKVGFDDFGVKASQAARGLKEFSNPAARATSALTDLGRVAQDAPFGFIAISNNLNPLLESFSRLKAETGSTGGALKALARGMTGAGGLGVALSLVTSVLSFATMGFGAWTRGFGKTKEEAKSLADTIKELIKPIKDLGTAAEASTTGEVVRVNALISVIRDQTASRTEQKRALEELRKVNKAYFGDLTLEKKDLAKLTQLQNEYTQAIVNQAILKNLESEIGKVGAEYLKQNKAIVENVNKQRALSQQIQATNKDQIEADAKAGVRTFFLNDQADALGKITQQIKSQKKEIQPLQDQFFALTQSIKDLTIQGLDFKGLNESKEKLQKEAKSFKLEFPTIEIPVSFGGKQIFSDSTKEMSDAFNNFKSFYEKKDDLKIDVPLQIDKSKPIIPPEKIQEAIDQLKVMQAELDAIGILVGGSLSDAFSGLFRTIATDGKLSMRQVGDAVKQLIVDLISAAIKAAVLAIILKVIGGNSATSSLGSLFKGLLFGGGTGMAQGGIVPAGYENDTFPARLSSREAVIPLDRLDGMFGSNNGGGTLTTRVSGNDLMFVLERTQRSQGRAFG